MAWRPDKGRRVCTGCGKWAGAAPSPCCGAQTRPGPQATFLSTYAGVWEVLNAGSVGSGKTDAGIMAPVVYPEYRRDPRFRALILRFNEKDLTKDITPRIEAPGAYLAYAGGGPLNQTTLIYRMKSGARVIFGHAKNLLSLQGQEYQYVWWDELTHWPTPEAYLYVGFTRVRSASGLPVRIRAGTNATGPGKRWVKERWGPWLDARYLTPPKDAGAAVHRGAEQLRALGYEPRAGLPPCPSGHVLHYTVSESGEEAWAAPGTPGALTRTCLRSRTEDNPALAEGDPMYATRIRAAGALLYRQLAGDDWDVEEAGEGFFRREWFVGPDNPLLATLPPLAMTVSRWDFAWTKKRKSDFSTRVKLGLGIDGHLYLQHILRTKGNPDEVKALVRATAETDGRAVPVIIPLNYADSLYVLNDLVRELAGYQVAGQREVGAKEVRIATLQPQAQARRIHLLGGAWVDTFLDEAAAYKGDGTGHDDQLDALAGAFLHLVDGKHAGITAPQREAVDRFVEAFGRGTTAQMVDGGGGGWFPDEDHGGGAWGGAYGALI